ncbi:MAG: hypothetical protein F6K24_14480 [Okeania sp. SIO2D1]|nr:hypothetical protein [Okeania sp. SIO2D1]
MSSNLEVKVIQIGTQSGVFTQIVFATTLSLAGTVLPSATIAQETSDLSFGQFSQRITIAPRTSRNSNSIDQNNSSDRGSGIPGKNEGR